jgi:CheY-like chemotaxis protein
VSTITTTVPAATGLNAAANGRKILVAVDDLFFAAKIQETARKLGVNIEFAKTAADILAKAEALPALIIFDLNSVAAKPINTIQRLRQNPALKKVSLIGFVSHVQAELKLQAQQAGCDLVMPRSAFSQSLPNLLRRHGLPEPE